MAAKWQNKVIASGDGMNVSEVFNCRIPLRPFGAYPGGQPTEPDKHVIGGSQDSISATNKSAEGPGGRQNGYSFEVLGNAENYSTGERRTADIILESGDKSVTIQYSAQVVTAPQEIEAFNVRKCFD